MSDGANMLVSVVFLVAMLIGLWAWSVDKLCRWQIRRHDARDALERRLRAQYRPADMFRPAEWRR